MLKNNTKLQPDDIKGMTSVLSYMPKNYENEVNKETKKKDIEKIFNKSSKKNKKK
jgi:hypothetical protein